MRPPSIFRFGPLPDLSFDLSVGEYLRHSPPKDDLDCLKKFFERLRDEPIVGGDAITHHIWHFASCNHVIEILVVSPGSGIVNKIYRDISSSVRP